MTNTIIAFGIGGYLMTNIYPVIEYLVLNNVQTFLIKREFRKRRKIMEEIFENMNKKMEEMEK